MDGPSGDRGVNWRAVRSLFELQEERGEAWDYTVKVSMLEVYNETIIDLLPSTHDSDTGAESKTNSSSSSSSSSSGGGGGGGGGSSGAGLEVRQKSGRKGATSVFVAGLSEVVVSSADDAMEVRTCWC